jgi:hypothetical protein
MALTKESDPTLEAIFAGREPLYASEIVRLYRLAPE